MPNWKTSANGLQYSLRYTVPVCGQAYDVQIVIDSVEGNAPDQGFWRADVHITKKVRVILGWDYDAAMRFYISQAELEDCQSSAINAAERLLESQHVIACLTGRV